MRIFKQVIDNCKFSLQLIKHLKFTNYFPLNFNFKLKNPNFSKTSILQIFLFLKQHILSCSN